MRALALAMLVTACSPPPMQSTCLPATGVSFDEPADKFQVAGDVMTVVMSIATWCPDDIAVKAVVSVLDPRDQPLPLADGDAERSITARDMTIGMSTRVSVLATLPGAYHFTARFEPNFGLVQRDIIAAENHRDAGADVVASGASGLSGCSHVDVSSGGRVVCLEPPPVRVFAADGTLLQTLPTRGALAGSVLWTDDDALTAMRWVEGDAGFVAPPDSGVTLQPTNPFLLPTPTDLLAVGQFNEWWRVSLVGGLVVENLAAPGIDTLAVWRSQDFATTLGTTEFCSGTFTDGGMTCSGGTGGFTQLPIPFASDPAGIWALSPAFSAGSGSNTLTLFKPSTVNSLILPESWLPPDAGVQVQWDTGAMLLGPSGNVLLVTERAGSFVLQKYPDALKVISVTGAYVALHEQSTGRVFIYKR